MGGRLPAVNRLSHRLARIVLPALVTLSGCVGNLPHGDTPAVERTPAPAPVLREFCNPEAPVDAEVRQVAEKRHFQVFEGSFPSGIPNDDDPTPITFEWYHPEGVERAPVALVLPILNGQKHIVRPFATHFAKHGYAAIIVDSRQRTTLTDDVIAPQAAIRQAVRRHRRVLDWIETEPRFDPDRIVVFGASLGGFNAFFLAASDQRVRAVAPALVAADLPYVFTQSNERRINAAVSEAMARLDVDREGLEAHMREHIDTDTAFLAPYLDSSRILMVLAKRDKAVPYAKQQELRGLLGNPEAIELPTGHVSSASYIFYLRRRILEFFDATLSRPEGSVTSISPEICLARHASPIMTTE
jgi:acetyl esterase/lipase